VAVPETVLQDAWHRGAVPIAEAICFPDGRMLLLSLNWEPGDVPLVSVLEETRIEQFLSKQPDWFAEVDPLCELALPGLGTLLAGGGSSGADGFFALVDDHSQLVYSAFFTSSNPFVALELRQPPSGISVFSTAQTEWSFDYNEPWNLTIRRVDRPDLCKRA
jgi:hypothetical protein